MKTNPPTRSKVRSAIIASDPINITKLKMPKTKPSALKPMHLSAPKDKWTSATNFKE